VRVCVCVHVLTFCVFLSQAALSVASCLHVLTFRVSLSGCFVCAIALFLKGTKYISVLVLLYF
jgi:hypothetical protein